MIRITKTGENTFKIDIEEGSHVNDVLDGTLTLILVLSRQLKISILKLTSDLYDNAMKCQKTMDILEEKTGDEPKKERSFDQNFGGFTSEEKN